MRRSEVSGELRAARAASRYSEALYHVGEVGIALTGSWVIFSEYGIKKFRSCRPGKPKYPLENFMLRGLMMNDFLDY